MRTHIEGPPVVPEAKVKGLVHNLMQLCQVPKYRVRCTTASESIQALLFMKPTAHTLSITTENCVMFNKRYSLVNNYLINYNDQLK